MKITTKGNVRFSYANVFQPKTAPGSTDLKYSCALLIDKKDTATVKQINEAIASALQAGKEKFGSKWAPSKGLKMRDGDEEKEGDTTYEGKFFINANNKNKPLVVDKDVNPIIDPEEFYSGCYGKASITFFPYDTVSKGIGCALNGVQKVKDGEPLGNTIIAENEFGKEEDDDIL